MALGEILMVDPARVWRAAYGGISDKRRPADVRTRLKGPAVSILGGDWDAGEWGTKIAPLKERSDLKALRQHFGHGMPWSETKFYRKYVQRLNEGKPIHRPRSGVPHEHITTEEQFVDFLADYDALFAAIRDLGYKSQAELGLPDSLDEIRVGIDRGGHLIALGGRHRLTIAQILKLPQVPMRLVVRHAEWDAFRREIERHARERWEGKVYQRLSHPDLQHLPGAHEEHKRVDLIRAALAGRRWKGKRLLDLGTHWGYWAEQMEKLGFDCVGIELRKEDADIAEKLRVANDGRYAIWQGNLTAYPDARADVVLALSIFHHLVGKDESHARLTAFLQRLETGVMFFEPPTRNVVRYQPEEFVRFVSEHARLPNVELLGVTGRRPLYKLTR